MESLKNKVAVITGSSAGIGEGTAILFAKLGCHLTLTGRDDNKLKAVAQRCVEAGCPADKIAMVTGDIRDKAVQQELLDKTLATFGRVDILINNAGLIHKALTLKTTEQQYDDIMDVNVKSVLFLTKLMAPELIKTKGSVVNVSSICGSCAMNVIGAYCISKAAVDMLTKCVALELAPSGVRVNSVNPATVVSDIYKRGSDGYNEEQYAQYLEAQKLKHPLGGVAYPEDVANSIAFLVSDLARFTSGTSVFVDGARHCVSSGVTIVPKSPAGDK